MGSRFGKARDKPAVKTAVALTMALQAGSCAYAAFRFFDDSTLNDPVMGVSLGVLALLFVGGAMLMSGQVMTAVRQAKTARKLAVLELTEGKPPV